MCCLLTVLGEADIAGNILEASATGTFPAAAGTLPMRSCSRHASAVDASGLI